MECLGLINLTGVAKESIGGRQSSKMAEDAWGREPCPDGWEGSQQVASLLAG